MQFRLFKHTVCRCLPYVPACVPHHCLSPGHCRYSPLTYDLPQPRGAVYVVCSCLGNSSRWTAGNVTKNVSSFFPTTPCPFISYPTLSSSLLILPETTWSSLCRPRSRWRWRRDRVSGGACSSCSCSYSGEEGGRVRSLSVVENNTLAANLEHMLAKARAGQCAIKENEGEEGQVLLSSHCYFSPSIISLIMILPSR